MIYMTNEFCRLCADAAAAAQTLTFSTWKRIRGSREKVEEKSGALSLFQSVVGTSAGKCCFIIRNVSAPTSGACHLEVDSREQFGFKSAVNLLHSFSVSAPFLKLSGVIYER